MNYVDENLNHDIKEKIFSKFETREDVINFLKKYVEATKLNKKAIFNKLKDVYGKRAFDFDYTIDDAKLDQFVSECKEGKIEQMIMNPNKEYSNAELGVCRLFNINSCILSNIEKVYFYAYKKYQANELDVAVKYLEKLFELKVNVYYVEDDKISDTYDFRRFLFELAEEDVLTCEDYYGLYYEILIKQNEIDKLKEKLRGEPYVIYGALCSRSGEIHTLLRRIIKEVIMEDLKSGLHDYDYYQLTIDMLKDNEINDLVTFSDGNLEA